MKSFAQDDVSKNSTVLCREDEITFDDLAFHNTTLYSTFSQMIIDASSPELSEEEFQEVYSCNFEVRLRTSHFFKPK